LYILFSVYCTDFRMLDQNRRCSWVSWKRFGLLYSRRMRSSLHLRYQRLHCFWLQPCDRPWSWSLRDSVFNRNRTCSRKGENLPLRT